MFAASLLVRRLTEIIEPLRATVAAHASWHWVVIPVVALLHAYLHRLIGRFAAAASRAADDCRVPVRAPRPDRPARAPRPRLPRGFAWLARMAPETNAYASQLRHLLSGAEMQRLLAASPRAATILRPLCRMFGIDAADASLSPALFRPRRAPPGPAATADTAPTSPAPTSPAPTSPAPASPAPAAPSLRPPWRHAPA